ncbi:MAG: serine/threonine protein phosphatase, partial [Mycobacterium sp.]|nr:serine/threonine protein phosphatase [Mycobacterium sp.]
YGGQTQPIIAGAVSGDDGHPIAPPNTAAGRAALIAPKTPAVEKAAPEPEPPPRKSRRGPLIAAALVLALVLGGIALGYNMIRGYYYVGAQDGHVAIMRGIQGSFLGVPLQQPYQLGCINKTNELSQISYGQANTPLDCDLMRLQDLRPSERAQVSAGLPAGSLDDAIGQLRELAHSSLLPLCSAAKPAPRSGSGAPSAPGPSSTAAAPSSAPSPSTSSPASSATSSAASSTSTAASTTALPAPQQKPGTDCRTAA